MLADPAPLGHEEKLVGVAVYGRDVDLRGEVRARVHLVEHVEGRELRVAQVARLVRLIDAAREGLLVAAAGEHVLALLAHHDGGARVLTHREHTARGDGGVLEQVEGHEAVVGRGLRVVENLPQLREVTGPKQVRDVAHGLAREERESLRIDAEKGLTERLEGRHMIGRHEAKGRVVVAERERVLRREGAHRGREDTPRAHRPATGFRPNRPGDSKLGLKVFYRPPLR